jgi:hypothetical protein
MDAEGFQVSVGTTLTSSASRIEKTMSDLQVLVAQLHELVEDRSEEARIWGKWSSFGAGGLVLEYAECAPWGYLETLQ